MATSIKLNILYGEGDADVAASQAETMRKAGHQVQTAVGRKNVESAILAGNFDLVVLGATLTRDDRHHLPYVVKKSHDSLKVLVMHADGGRHPAVDDIVDTGSSIATLLEKVALIMGKNAKAAGVGR